MIAEDPRTRSGAMRAPLRPGESRATFLPNVVTAALLTAIASACSPGAERPASLRGKVLSRSDSLALPYKIEVHGDRLAVIDRGMDQVLHVYDRGSGRHLRSAMGRGDGPGEVRSPWSLHVRAGDICVWDFSNSKSLCAGGHGEGTVAEGGARELVIDDPTLLRKDVALIDVAIASDSLLVGLSYKKPGQVAVVNYEAGTTSRFITYHDRRRSSLQVPRTLLLNGDLKMRPGTDQFVFAPRAGGEIFVGDLSGEIRRIEGPVPFSVTEPPPEAAGPGRRAGRRVGYISIDVTSEAVYGLFSGKQRGGTLEDIRDAMTGRHLHVYSWDTESWHTWRLDVPGVAIAVADSRLYMIARELVPEIRVYGLDSLPGPARDETPASAAGKS